MKDYQLFVGGDYIPASSDAMRESLNPMTGDVFARVAQATVEDAEKAIGIAHEAFKEWGNTAPAKREEIMLKAADIMASRFEDLRDTLIDEAGSTFIKASYEAGHTPDFIRCMAGECRRVFGDTYESSMPGVKSYSIRRPLGVVTAISPFNFPLLLATRKIGWALAAGNTVVLKPSDNTPVIALKLAEIFKEAGLPDGVFNVITGRGSVIGDTLIDDPRVRYVTFTGSSAVGKEVGARAARGMKKFALELGGKNPIIVLDDADVDYACTAAAFSNYFHQGQICMTGSKVIVEAGIYDEFVEKFTAKVQTLKAGDPHSPETVVGPLITPEQAPFIAGQIEMAVKEGARVTTGGTYEGALFQPTVLADVTEDMGVFKTELFGPCASIIKADDYLHALALANNNDYGLSSACITNDLQKAIYISENIEAGMHHINGPTVRDEGVIPFGGVKDSGYGREGGHFAMEELTELKWITIQTGQQQFPPHFSK